MADDGVASKVALWRGTGDGYAVEEWADGVDRLATQKNWTNPRTAAAVRDAFRDEAAVWAASIKHSEEAATLDTWVVLRPAVVARFSKVKTSLQKQKMVSNLVQKTNEGVAAFFDRVMYAMGQIHQPLIADLVDPDRDAKVEGYRACLNTTIGTMFLAGVLPEIRKQAQMELGEAPTTVLCELGIIILYINERLRDTENECSVYEKDE